MKVAGRKNDGAWYRTNKFIKNQPQSWKDRAKTDGEIISIAGDVLGVMNNLTGGDPAAFAAVMEADGLPKTAAKLAEIWMNQGIPRQIYQGRLSWDRYEKVTAHGSLPAGATKRGGQNDIPSENMMGQIPTRFYAQNTYTMQQVGNRLRKKMNDFRLVARSLQDLANVSSNRQLNPGGVADATKIT